MGKCLGESPESCCFFMHIGRLKKLGSVVAAATAEKEMNLPARGKGRQGETAAVPSGYSQKVLPTLEDSLPCSTDTSWKCFHRLPRGGSD